MNSPSQLSEYSTVDCNRLDMLDSLAIVVIPRKQFHLLIATNQSQEIPRSWKITRWTRYFENLKISEYHISMQIHPYVSTHKLHGYNRNKLSRKSYEITNEFY